MRSVINISLPTTLANAVEQEVETGKYATKSEFFRTLLRNWMEERLLKDLNQSRNEIVNDKGKLLKSLKDLR